MENSDSGSERDESEARNRSQMDQSVQEEDFYQFVNNLSKDDYKPMRDNDLLGDPGEELYRRHLLSKENLLENSDESTDEGDRVDDASSSDSLLDWLMSFETTEHVTAGRREQPPRREVSQVNLLSDFRSISEINVNFPNECPNEKEEYTPSTRLPTGRNRKNSQRRVECPQAGPRFTRPPRSEQSRTRALLEVPPTRGQKRDRSRSPDHSRTRNRSESTPLPRLLGLRSQRPQHSLSSLRSGSAMDQLNSATRAENVRSGQREHQPWREVSQFKPHSDFRCSSEINVNFNKGGPNAREEYTPSTRLPTGGNRKNSQRRVECPQAEPRFTRPPRSEQSRTGALLEVPPTRGQKRDRSRSPDHSRTRARFDSTPLPRLLGLHSQRPQHSLSSLRSGSAMDQFNSATRAENVRTGQREHQPWREVSQFKPPSDFRSSSEINVNFNNRGPKAREEYTPSTRLPTGGNRKNSQRQVECPQAEPRFTRPRRSEQSRTGALLEVPPTRGQQTARSRSQDQSGTRVSTESRSPAQSLGELLPRLHHSASSLTFEQPMVHETERFSRIQHHETLRQQITARELQKRVLFANSETRNAIQGESSPDTTSDGQSCHLRHMYPTISFYSETGQVHPVAYSERESVTRRSQIPSETPNHTITSESEQEGFGHMFLHYEQGDVTAYVSTIRIPIYRTLNTSLNDTTSGAIPNMLSLAMTDFSDTRSLLDSDSDSESSFSSPSPNTSSSGSDSSHGSRDSSSNSLSSWDYYPPVTVISSSDSSYMSTSTSSLMSSSSSSDESSETLTVLFESSDEGDAWPSLDDHPTGLSEAQIDNLATRSSVKDDTLNECSICITEYREGSQLRILPCSHEFHVCCIDRWLSDNSTCPICRRNVVDSSERGNTN
ncbi:E3 ubiquitin-protein ligase RLIM-like [Artibeus jamaicensis]|uniref:E3 ubiquitin-protein ligase RLIM-like n=1 Tax=Artibeus jamaicensis TaxID=9417 RepID=UPI00235AAFD4|nr:E3 ubiquitin-protein ligase RLIM-like [Artibeus jamaicensis]